MISFTHTKMLIILSFAHQLATQTTYTCKPSATCGCSANSATISKIVGGEDASPNTWGWMVHLQINGTLQCGGSILSSTWILTAAHCIPPGTSSIIVRAGSVNRFMGTQKVSVSNAYIHPKYNASGFIHDIALLKLITPLDLNAKGVDTICLPSVSAATLAAGEWPLANTTVVAIGWGRIAENLLMIPAILQQVTLITVSRSDPTCSSVIIDWNLHFCAGVIGGGKGTCQGDSGGPIMMFNDAWYVVGIVNYGIGCASAQYSGVYARVAYYQDWLTWIMNGNGDGVSIKMSVSTMSSGQTCNDPYYVSTLLFVVVIMKFVMKF